MEKLGFGIIGAGLMGCRRAESLNRFPETKLISVADLDEYKAKQVSEKYNCRYTTNYQDILKDETIKCVIISVTNNFLARITKEALEKGKHILVEKPVATNMNELNEIIRISKEKNLIVKAGFNHRFLPTIKKAKEIFDSNQLGELMFIKTTYGQKGRIGFEKEWRTKKELSGGGQLIDQGVHVIDLCIFFMGDIKSVEGWASNLFWRTDVDDNDFLLLKNLKNKIAFIHTSSSLWRNTFNFEIQCAKGRMEIEGLRGHYGTPKLRILRRNEEKSKKFGVYQFDEEEIKFPDEDVSFIEEMKNFLNCIKGKEAISGNLMDAKKVLTIVFDLYSKNGEEIN